MIVLPAVYSACPVGSIIMRPQYGTWAEVAAAGTAVMVLAAGSYSKKKVGAWKVAGTVMGPAVNNTLPFGSTTAGASTGPSGWPGLTCGIVGPCAHVPGSFAMDG